MKMFYLYLLVVNIITFLAYGMDKRKARRRQWRIPERTLLGLAAMGGAAGAYVGMGLFRHKTRKPAFRYGVPVLLIIWLSILYYIVK